MNNTLDLIIIGAGPAGITAAIYASRAKLNFVIFEKEVPGGKLSKTATIANWPGENLIGGTDLAMKMYNQLTNLKVNMIFSTITHISQTDEDNYLVEANGIKYITKSLLIATGTVERKLGVPGEQRLYGRGLSYCAVCDGALYEGKEVVVVGGGRSALEEALYLTRFSPVTLIHRNENFKADQKMIEEVRENPQIKLITDTVLEEIIGEEKVEGIKVKNLKTQEQTNINCSAVFPFIGLDPATEFISSLKVLDSSGYIVTDENMATSIKGLYAAGDVRKKNLRQIVTATSDGAIAISSITTYLKNKE